MHRLQPRTASAAPRDMGSNPADRRIGSVALLTEDDELGHQLGSYLRQHGLAVTEVSGSAALESRLLTQAIDVIILDGTLPGEDGFSLCRHLSVSRAPPVILLTPTGDPVDRIVGLEVGADDCVGKAGDNREVLARIRALLRRATINDAREMGDGDDLLFSGWRLSLRSHRLHAPNGSFQDLAPSEFDLLKSFLEHPNEVLVRAQLRALVGEEDGEDRLIDTRVQRLRTKLAKAQSGGASLIRTVNGRGYLLESSVQRVPSASGAALIRMVGQVRP